jgi:ATP-binding cassette subfamily F protein uup
VQEAAAEREAQQAKVKSVAAKGGADSSTRGSGVRAGKLSFNEKRELDQLPERISALEAEQVSLQARIGDPSLYQEAPQEVAQINARLAALDAELEMALERWTELETKAGG